MKKYFTLFFITLFFNALPQTDSIQTNFWKTEGTVGLNINQIALSNWSQGGDNALAWTVVLNMAANYSSKDINLRNSLKVAYGRTKLGDADYRTNDNELFQESVLAYLLGWAIDPYISNSIRTSVGNGFDYKATPYFQVASFFDPGYITQSIGFAYNRIEGFNTRIGLAFQETFTNDYPQYSDDPDTKDEIEKFKFDTGIETVTEGRVTFEQNLSLTSKLRLFSRFNSLDVWDVRWDNTITAQVIKYVNVNLNVLLIYEKSQSLKTQIKEALQLGVVVNLF